jgi:hypothetical protein
MLAKQQGIKGEKKKLEGKKGKGNGIKGGKGW